MDTITIEGIAGYDGVYEFELSGLKNVEWYEIKKQCGVRSREAIEALIAGDISFVVALAIVVLRRTGKPVIDQMLWDAEGGSIKFEFGGADADPPAVSGAPSENGETNSDSGDGSAKPSAANPETTPPGSGGPGSDTGATSASETSAS